MQKRKTIDWTKYRLRTCYTLHHCRVCNKDIRIGQIYYDGGYSRRAHADCVTMNANGQGGDVVVGHLKTGENDENNQRSN